MKLRKDDSSQGRRSSGLAAGLTILLLAAGTAVAQEAVSSGEVQPEATTRVEVGQVAPAFDLEAPDGTRHSLTELRDKKNLVLVFFRGTW